MTFITGYSETNSGTIVTIPAGKIWKGSLSLSCSSTANGRASITFEGGGIGAVPVAGTVLLACWIRVPGFGVESGSNRTGDIYVQAGDAAATLRLNKSTITDAGATVSGTTLNS